MSYRLLFLLWLLMPAMAFAQERKDYKEAMGKIMQCYNSNNAACINELFANRASNRGYYTQQKINDLRYRMREMLSFKYLRQREDGLIIFKVTYAKYHGEYKDLYRDHKGWVGLRLDRNNKITRLSLPASAYLDEHYLLN